ncbi:Aminoglycoside phosphotransferase [Beauveria brongniartii RCEF 3172]|uniref:Aminoglycoside phosphotransferase n=1 Tax=Beauveria brongniartii RCEF 3172 TaxID=1081107 RepID=A0A162K2W6_9HYPO|nr:Aminoglycoside phosphotransferase [Beauveria brongniartii RCEF 3172]
MILPNDSSQEEPQQLHREHWASLPQLPRFSGPTVPTIGRRFFKHSPTTILKLGTDDGEGIMTALAYSILGPCVPRVISIVTYPIAASGDSTLNRTKQGLVLTHLPGTPLVHLWPSLTPPQREAVKAELCRLLVRMRSRRFSYYGRPMQQPYLLVSEYGTEEFVCCASRSEWDDSRVHAMQKNASDAERAVDLERVQRGGTTGADDWDRPVLTHGDLSDRNILVDPDTLAVTGFLDWEMANIMPAYFEYVAARLSGGHQPAWRKELLDVLRSVLRCECDVGRWDDQGAANIDEGHDSYERTLAAWDAVVDVERIAQGYDDKCYWTFEH